MEHFSVRCIQTSKMIFFSISLSNFLLNCILSRLKKNRRKKTRRVHNKKEREKKRINFVLSLKLLFSKYFETENNLFLRREKLFFILFFYKRAFQLSIIFAFLCFETFPS